MRKPCALRMRLSVVYAFVYLERAHNAVLRRNENTRVAHFIYILHIQLKCITRAIQGLRDVRDRNLKCTSVVSALIRSKLIALRRNSGQIIRFTLKIN